MPNQRQDRLGLLVVRAFVELGRRRTILVRLLEVNPRGPDQVIGTADSSGAAARLLEQWLDSLLVDSDARVEGPGVVDRGR